MQLKVVHDIQCTFDSCFCYCLQLDSAVNTVKFDNSVRVVILASEAAGAFCAGKYKFVSVNLCACTLQDSPGF